MKASVFSFKTLGCRLNQAEEERLRRQVLEAGYFISEPSRADFCVVNTCSVTALADKKSHQAIRKLKADNPKMKIIVIGCGAEASKEYSEVDLWIPNSQKDKVLGIIISKFELINQFKKENSKKPIENCKLIIKNSPSNRTRGLLKVADGCNNFCAYCIVPYLRGREVSFAPEEVIAEAKKLEELGYKELVISGVNVGRYGFRSQKSSSGPFQSEFDNSETHSKIENRKSKFGLVDLLQLILSETDFPRIRLSSVNPQDISDEMIKLWAAEPRLCNHFHLSLQSGANNVLKSMGRPYSREQYLKLRKRIIQKVPNMAITTDVIVGFPGESEADFADSIELVTEAKLAKLHVFRYSKRVGTRAAEFSEQISDAVKKERSQKLIKVGQKLEKDFKNQFVGQKVEVLFEEQKNGFWYGLTDNYIRVKYPSAKNLENQFKTIILKEEYLA